ncbi:hypothetical protein [Limosilactobacillus reuteri]|uniref:hypothetical protein n=1 Tax=Limosilactobacillus reuteri TaxID=1598 RepID=UPI001C5B7D36|nr:hypothetical protein [Limosilactobacillus reuteri]MBW3349570.1 hypothetical protein [Limosilactobacillus reuteri]UUW69454.1 hypothetical protein NUJ10_05085 [Limosilactobacillus reuteri]
MSKQRKIHQKARARQQVYRTGRKLAFKFGYKHGSRWRKLAMDLDRPALLQRAYNIFGPEDLGASVRGGVLDEVD